MPKIVYLFGAGASYDTLPLVKDMSERIQKVLTSLTPTSLLLSDTEIFPYPEAKDKSKREYQMQMIKGLEWLKDACDKHYSIDTYAKKLYLKTDHASLDKLKVFLSIYFVLEQAINKPNPRYDFFFASIIDSLAKLPDNIRILNWNYDSQFEIAFSEYSEKTTIEENRRELRVHDRESLHKDDIKGFGIFKLNGSTELYIDDYPHKTKFFFNSEATPELEIKFMESVVLTYVRSLYLKGINLYMSFAWEEPYFEEYTNIIIEEIKDAEVLVVIGYSFPYFNRSVDRKIISGMSDLRKVYFQSPEANELIQRFQSIRNDMSRNILIPHFDLKYFLLPNEL